MYKLSALGEYTWAILQYGTTKSYSTQTVCSLHYNFNLVLIIDWIERVNLNIGTLSIFMPGQTRQRPMLPRSPNTFVTSMFLGKIFKCARIKAANNTGKPCPPSSGTGTSELPPDPQVQVNIGQHSIPFEQSDPLPLTPPEVHHHISNTQQFYKNIPQWLDLHDGDLALIICAFHVVLLL